VIADLFYFVGLFWIIPRACIDRNSAEDRGHVVLVGEADVIGDKQVEVLKGLAEGDKVLLEAPKEK